MTSLPQGKRPVQLPNMVREFLLGVDAPKTAIVLDLLYTLGYKAGQWITFKECVDICSEHTAIHIIREGLQHWTIKQKKLPTTKPGRPTFAYCIPGIDYLRSLPLEKPTYVTDILDFEDFRNVKSYRMALHRELIRRGYEDNDNQPMVFSRKFMAERLNVSPETLRNYEKELDTYVQPRWDNQRIWHDFEIKYLPDKKCHDGRYLVVKTNSNHPILDEVVVGRFPCVASIAGMYYKKGYELWVVRRACNAYAPYSPYSEQGKRDSFGDWADIINQ